MRAAGIAVCAVTLPFVSALAQGVAHSARIVGVVGDSVSAAPLRGACPREWSSQGWVGALKRVRGHSVPMAEGQSLSATL